MKTTLKLLFALSLFIGFACDSSDDDGDSETCYECSFPGGGSTEICGTEDVIRSAIEDLENTTPGVNCEKK